MQWICVFNIGMINLREEEVFSLVFDGIDGLFAWLSLCDRKVYYSSSSLCLFCSHQLHDVVWKSAQKWRYICVSRASLSVHQHICWVSLLFRFSRA